MMSALSKATAESKFQTGCCENAETEHVFEQADAEKFHLYAHNGKHHF